MDDADLSLEKIEISGPILASLIQRVSSSPGNVDGLLFGQIHRIVSSNLTDDSPAAASDQIIATVTSFVCSGKALSFYDALGRVDPRRIDHLRADTPDCLIGWFSGRRRTVNHPSVRESAVASNLSSQFHLPIEDSGNPNSVNLASSSVFFLLTTPEKDQLIHTHQYRAYQFRSSDLLFEPRSIGVVNIGPAFRGHYGSFSPKSAFPLMMCESRSWAMSVDYDEGSLNAKKQAVKDQKELDALADGFHVGSLRRLVGAEAANYTGGLEDLYEKMLDKVETMVSDLQLSSARVYEQNNQNSMLRG